MAATNERTIKVHILIDGEEHVIQTSHEIQQQVTSAMGRVKDYTDQVKEANEELAELNKKAKEGTITEAEKLRRTTLEQTISTLNQNLSVEKGLITALTKQYKDLLNSQTDLNSIIGRGEKGAYRLGDMKRDQRAMTSKAKDLDPEKEDDMRELAIINEEMGKRNYWVKEMTEGFKQSIMPAEKLQKVLKDMADPKVGASMNDLNSASKELQRQLSQMSPQNGKYAETAENYRKVTEEIKRQKEELKGVSGTEQEVTQSVLRQIEARKAAAAAVGEESAEEKKEFETIDEIFVKYHKLNEEIARLKDLESKGNATLQDVQMIKKLNQEAGEYEATISLIHEEEGEVKTARLKTLVDDLKAASDKMEQYESEMVSKYGNGRPTEQFWDVSEKMTDEENEKWSQLNKVIEQAQGALKGFKLTEEEVAALDVVPVEEVEAVKDATLSMQNLERAMKFLKDEGNKLEIGSPEWEDNQKKIEEIKQLKEELAGTKKELIDIDELRSRIPDASLDELKAAKKQLSEQFGGMKKGDTGYDQTIEDIKAIDAQIKVVQDSLKGVKSEVVDVDKILADLAHNDNVRLGLDTGEAVIETDKLKNAQEQLKKELASVNLTEEKRVATSKKLSTVQQELARREKIVADETKRAAQAAKDAEIGYNGYAGVLDNIKGSTLPQMKRAVEDMQKELEKLPVNSREYKTMADNIAKVRNAVKEATDAQTKHASAIEQAISRLKTYVMIYMGFNKLLDVVGKYRESVMQLSDSIADIQKVTKMSEEAVDNLSDAINGISTRSSIEQLHKLGYQAGLMGLSAEKDVLGFVNAANQMNWALKELGEDGAVQLMKVANMTGDIKKLGVEQALTKIGSAINEITANSAASAGPVTEIVSRLGAIGSQAGYASHELVGIASTMNALGLKSEASATAVQKIMMALQTNISPIAEKIGVSADTIRAQGSAMEQLLFVLKTLRDQTNGSANAFEVLKPIFKDMGRDGTRLASTLTTLVKNYDTLTYHLNTTSEAYEEGVSMLNEYNVKNETAAAQIERIGNAIAKTFTNSFVTRTLQTILQPLTWMFEKTRLVAGAMEAMGTAAAVGLGYKVVTGLKAMTAAMKQSIADTNASIIAKRTEIAVQDELNAAKARGVQITREDALANAQASGAINTHVSSMQRLGAAMKGMGVIGWVSVISMAVPVVIELTRWIYKLVEGTARVDQVMQETLLTEEDFISAQNEAVTSVKKEDRALTALYERLHKAKGKKEELHDIMVILKNKYPQYLKNINTEAESYRNVEEALKAVNEQLRIQALVKMRSSLMESAQTEKDSKEAGVTKTVADNLESLFNRVGGKSSIPLNELKAKISEAIGEAAEKGLSIGMTKQKIKKIVNDNVKGADWNLSASTSLQNLAAQAIKLQDINRASAKAEKEINDQVNTYTSMFGVDVKKVNEAVASSAQEAASGLNAVSRQIGEIEGQDPAVLKQWYDQLDRLGKMVKKQKDGSLSPEFVRLYKEAFGVDPKNMREATNEIARMSEVIKQEMNSQQFNTAAGHQSPKHGRTSHKKVITIGGVSMTEEEINQAYQAALSALKGYYEEQRKIQLQYRVDNKITDAELESQLSILKRNEMFDTEQLYNVLLDRASTFKQELYGEWFADKNLHQLSQFLKHMGVAMTDGMKKNAEAAGKAALEEVVKDMREMEKILLQRDLTGSVMKEYQDQLQKTGLFWASRMKNTMDANDEYVKEMQQMYEDLARNSMGMNEAMLKERMEEMMPFWVQQREEAGNLEDSLKALLIILQNYNEALLDAERRTKEQHRKQVETRYSESIAQQKRIVAIQTANEKLLQSLREKGWVRETSVMKMELDHIKQRVKWQIEYIAKLEIANADTKKAYEDLNALGVEQREKMIAIQDAIAAHFKEYSDELKTMLSSVAAAGAEHQNWTSLAEISAKRKLGIAVDETKKEYMIYSRNGKAVRKMMTEEERLKWEIRNEARNKQLDAVNEWMQKMGEKMSEDLTLAVSNRLVMETQEREQREQMNRLHKETDAAVNEEQRKADAVNSAEVALTGQIVAQIQERYNAFVQGQRDEVEAMRKAAQEKAAIAAGQIEPNNPQPKTPGNGGTGIAPGNVPTTGAASDAPTTNGTAVKPYTSYYADENAGVAGSGDETWADIAMHRTLGTAYVMGDRVKEVNAETVSDTLNAHSAMMESHKSTVQAMVQGMNMYGIAYNAVMNDSLSVSQRVGLATLQSFGQVAMSMLSVVLSDTLASIASGTAEGTAKIWGKFGANPYVAAGLTAGLTAVLGAALAVATRKITKSKQEISAVTGAASGKKVAAGMLTYAEGNYPVLGSDGEVYNAKRETNWKTKVYSSPHYGILGEKGPELIVDGVTTRKMMTLRPDLYQDILALAHGEQAVRAKAYADGNYPAMPSVNGGGGAGDDTNSMLVAAISQLNAQLAGGIKVAALGEDGAVRRLNEAEDWMRKHGLA